MKTSVFRLCGREAVVFTVLVLRLISVHVFGLKTKKKMFFFRRGKSNVIINVTYCMEP